MKKIIWASYAARRFLKKKLHIKRKPGSPYGGRRFTSDEEAAKELAGLIKSGKPFMAGRLGLFETAVMRMYEFGLKKKYALTMDNLYNCAGFFPNDISLGGRFTELMKDGLGQTDILACNLEFLEDYFVKTCLPKESVITKKFTLYENHKLDTHWSAALEGKKVLVVTPFSDSVKQQYEKRELLYKGSDILPEFELLTYKSLMTVGDLKDDRFENWFEALEFMEKEIASIDFDIALLGCGAYGFALAAAIKRSGRQAVHMGGVLQLLFGIMGRRWDGSRFGGAEKMEASLKKYYNEAWIYPIEGKPAEASRVEYGPYWK